MDRIDRLTHLERALRNRERPLTGSEIADQLGVTRQVVVHDIALLRAKGLDIVSTPRGYFVEIDNRRIRSLLAMYHTREQTATELNTFVDFGIRVIDVQVEHPIYGLITGGLSLSSRRDVRQFLDKLGDTGTNLLSSLTDGYHLHTVEADDLGQLDDAILELEKKGIRILQRD